MKNSLCVSSFYNFVSSLAFLLPQRIIYQSGPFSSETWIAFTFQRKSQTMLNSLENSIKKSTIFNSTQKSQANLLSKHTINLYITDARISFAVRFFSSLCCIATTIFFFVRGKFGVSRPISWTRHYNIHMYFAKRLFIFLPLTCSLFRSTSVQLTWITIFFDRRPAIPIDDSFRSETSKE